MSLREAFFPGTVHQGRCATKQSLMRRKGLLVYFEYGNEIDTAIFREKQIKAGSRQKKIDLVNQMNPEWKDLYEEYFG
jgi:predicted GIY-YIG superfamily endonuclease